MFLAYLRFHKLGGDVLAGRHEVHGQVAGAVLDLHILRHQNLLQDLQPGRHLPKHTARLVTWNQPSAEVGFCQSCPQTKKQSLSTFSVAIYQKQLLIYCWRSVLIRSSPFLGTMHLCCSKP